MAPSPSRAFLIWAFLGAGLLPGCASTGHLADYEYRARNLAAVTTAPPRPVFFSRDFWNPEGRRWWETLFRAGSEIARDVQAERAREKMEEASQGVDLAALMADGILERGARLLRARPVTSVQEADFEIETRVLEYGIWADSWRSRADFFVRAEVLLLDSESGREIWAAEVDARDPINPSGWSWGGSLGNLLSAQDLAALSVEEIGWALEGLAEFSARVLAGELEAALEKAGIR